MSIQPASPLDIDRPMREGRGLHGQQVYPSYMRRPFCRYWVWSTGLQGMGCLGISNFATTISKDFLFFVDIDYRADGGTLRDYFALPNHDSHLHQNAGSKRHLWKSTSPVYNLQYRQGQTYLEAFISLVLFTDRALRVHIHPATLAHLLLQHCHQLVILGYIVVLALRIRITIVTSAGILGPNTPPHRTW